MGIRFTAATPADEPGIRILLKDAGLPYEKFEAHLLTFITAKEGDALIGTMGMEVYGGVAPASAVRSTRALNSWRIAKAYKRSIC